MKPLLTRWLAVLVTLLFSSTTLAFDAASGKTAINNGVAFLEAQQDQTEGSWGNGTTLEYVYTSTAIEALRAARQKTGAFYSGVAWLQNNNPANVDLTSRKVMALANRQDVLSQDIEDLVKAKRDLDQIGWGLSSGYYSAPVDTSLAVRATYDSDTSYDINAVLDYMLNAQLSDGGWSVHSREVGDLSTTAEVVLALVNFPTEPGISAALSSASNFLSGVQGDLANTSTSSLARVLLALYLIDDTAPIVGQLADELLLRQVTAGDWGNVLASANAITTFSKIVGLPELTDETTVTFDDPKLRFLINETLGNSQYSFITSTDLEQLTSIDLSGTGISSTDGLQGAINLAELTVDSAVDLIGVSQNPNVSVTVNGTVFDSNAPILTIPPSLTVEATDALTSVNFGTVLATDGVWGTVPVFPSDSGPYAIGTHALVWTATDGSGNVATQNQTLVVQDTQPPELTIPNNRTIHVPDNSAIPVDIGQAIASDPSGYTITNNAPSQFQIGTTVVTWQATDGLNQTATADQTIIIQVVDENGDPLENQPLSQAKLAAVLTVFYFLLFEEDTRISIDRPDGLGISVALNQPTSDVYQVTDDEALFFEFGLQSSDVELCFDAFSNLGVVPGDVTIEVNGEPAAFAVGNNCYTILRDDQNRDNYVVVTVTVDGITLTLMNLLLSSL